MSCRAMTSLPTRARTDADSSARLVLHDNTNLLLGPASTIKLDRFVYSGPKEPGAIAVSFVKGALRFATGDADKKAYVISTPTASLGVRGTILKIDFLIDIQRLSCCSTKRRSPARAKPSDKQCLTLTDPNQVRGNHS